MFESLNKREFGARLESFACGQLEKQKCHILQVNFQCKLGEIDIIARDGPALIFVEVRYRKMNRFGGAIESVDLKKQRKIVKTAALYLQQNQLTNKVACRFDVFAIQGDLQRLEYNWIKDAFSS